MKSGGMRALLAISLLGTLLAAWFAPAPVDESVGLSERARLVASNSAPEAPRSALPESSIRFERANSPAASRVDVLSIRARGADADPDRLGSLFTAAKWGVSARAEPSSAKTPTTPLPTEPPRAPPLPFKFFGRYEEAGQAVIFLRNGEQNLAVRVGEIVAENYKVEEITGSTMTLRYLPLNQTQALELGAAQ